MTAVGDLLRIRRTESGLTQAELARRAGTAAAVVSRIERGLMQPTVPALERLALALDCELQVDFRPRP